MKYRFLATVSLLENNTLACFSSGVKCLEVYFHKEAGVTNPFAFRFFISFRVQVQNLYQNHVDAENNS